jgi:hypothetical protein
LGGFKKEDIKKLAREFGLKEYAERKKARILWAESMPSSSEKKEWFPEYY